MPERGYRSKAGDINFGEGYTYDFEDPLFDQGSGHYAEEFYQDAEEYSESYSYDYEDDDQGLDDVGEGFNVDEFDECYVNYIDARKQMNALRMSRGFYPVVALADTSSAPQFR